RTLEQVQQVARAIESQGRRALAVQVDVAVKAEVQRLAQQAERTFGRVDILVNNAGTFSVCPSEDLSEEDWDRVLDTNLKGAFLCSQAIGRLMMAQHFGRIINISSIAGVTAFPLRAAYCSSKAGLIQLTKVLAVEWGKHNITVNVVSPGFVRTELYDRQVAEGVFSDEELLRRSPVGRVAEIKDVVGAVCYLGSDDAAVVSGANLYVDGGWLAYGYI
ncbi:MAG: SDR family oxidoreductase, partial [Deinococcus sp.]|nr:SDR family oxidoreductase [Deinococcus sp.]